MSTSLRARGTAYRLYLPIGTMVALAILVGCASLQSETPADQEMTRAIKAALDADPTPMVSQVGVRTSGGRVTLFGWANDAAAERARQIARKIAGDQNVADFITVPDRLR
jgi:osmotically-inducible protein OsmY